MLAKTRCLYSGSIFRGLFLPGLMLWLVAAPAAAAGVAWLDTANARAQAVDDPVFDGRMMLYQAGPADAQTVVLVHGIGAGARDLAAVIDDLAADYRVVAVDLPGFGESSRGNKLYAPDQLALALHKALAPRLDTPFTLFGYSLGASVALTYAHAYPDAVRNLIVADMPGLLQRSVYARWLADNGVGLLGGGTGGGLGNLLTTLLGSQLAQLEAGGFNPAMLLYSPQARARFLGGDPRLIAALAAVEHDYGDALRDLRLPLLVLWGSQDAITPLRTGRVLAARVPDARLSLIANQGHMLPMAAPDALAAAIRAEMEGRMRGLPGYANPAEATAQAPTAHCNGEADQRITGRYARLTLENCAAAVIENASIGRLEVVGGDVQLINSHVTDGIRATSTNLMITAGSLAGAPPLLLANSDVDAAGTQFRAQYDLAVNRGAAPLTLWFSESRLDQAEGIQRRLHEVAQLPAGAAWP